MRILIQRVNSASVTINNQVHSQIGRGLLVFLGVHIDDTGQQIPWLAQKCSSLRIFEDGQHKMNLSIDQINGEILVVSQFTLYGSCHSGKRPEFTKSAKSDQAEGLYNKFVEELQSIYPKVQTGVFGADMKISLINDGPVTLMLEK
ncbi:MAG: D-aminoacyl-tRNA deacylase [Chlamydiae bacterium]|nr:D-aminoacyl-tRNA deacylase [Chlamydiota bacterium]